MSKIKSSIRRSLLSMWFAVTSTVMTIHTQPGKSAILCSQPVIFPLFPRQFWRSLLVELLLGAPENTLSRSLSNQLPEWRDRLMFRLPTWYALWREMSSFASRIREICARDVACNGLVLECRGSADCLSNIEWQAHSQDMQNLQRHYPWATQLDRLLYLEGWRQGFARGAHSGIEFARVSSLNPCTCGGLMLCRTEKLCNAPNVVG